MRSPAAAVILAAAATAAPAQEVRVFGVGIRIDDACAVAIDQGSGRSEIRTLPFSAAGGCRFLPFSETDIPRIEFIRGEYVLLVESRSEAGGACRGELAAITLSRDGRVRVSTRSQRTSVCGSGERKDYEILRHFTPR